VAASGPFGALHFCRSDFGISFRGLVCIRTRGRDDIRKGGRFSRSTVASENTIRSAKMPGAQISALLRGDSMRKNKNKGGGC
jgi:hypothetical protein